ncbi:MAG: histidine ammonia-lyase [Chloroherpetonaceae bacterium]|nr:histidine ammonia-lyase [Chloroherpetonaceae bacterium]MDW8438001.1 histidine ammonia-lyase [Chloroherpetonaceae bacterium]
MESAHLVLDGESLSLRQLNVAERVSLSETAKRKIQASRQVVERLACGEKAYYGVNTGFGVLARRKIAPTDLEKLQENLILSHAVGVGDLAPEPIVRLMLLLKVNALAKGYSGISLEAVDMLCEFFNQRLSPLVYSQGSVGASGDLAPLAHLVLAMMGIGEAMWRGEKMPASEALKRCGLSPYKLKSKEGLALINGTQFMLAYAVDAILRADVVAKTADLCAAMTLEAMRGSGAPFDERLHALRPYPGQIAVAENIRLLTTDSEIMRSHKDCQKVQDPYSLRCAPQVHGACRDAMDYARRVIEIELNAATDNPLVFENGDVISGGNFHGEPLALALDTLAIALAELASISERRIYLLLGGDSVGGVDLPKLLMRDTGLNSGFMLPQYAAAALVSENKILAHPASVDSIPTSLGQEDHVSMGSVSATKLHRVVQNVETVLAIELMCAAQAMDFLRPLTSGKGIEVAHAEIRKVVSHAESDRLFHDDIQAMLKLVQSGRVLRCVEQAIGALK